jgi:putative transcriptional regulator
MYGFMHPSRFRMSFAAVVFLSLLASRAVAGEADSTIRENPFREGEYEVLKNGRRVGTVRESPFRDGEREIQDRHGSRRAREKGTALEGLRQLKQGEYGRVVNVPSVADVRERTGLSQARFAELPGVSVRTLQDWEQGRRAPSGAARTLILVAAKNPRALLAVA